MNQNYNTPLFEYPVTFGDGGAPVVDQNEFSQLFKLQYPTAKEAINFVRSGGRIVCVGTIIGGGTDAYIFNHVTMDQYFIRNNGNIAFEYTIDGGEQGTIGYEAAGGGHEG